jgi:hypothetical protein
MSFPFTNHNTDKCKLKQQVENKWLGLSEEERNKIIQVGDKRKLKYLNNLAKIKVIQNIRERKKKR